MGNTREEERDPKYKVIKDLPWSEQTISERLRSYTVLSDVVERMESNIPADRQDAYFQLVKYPVQAAAQMNRKILTAQLPVTLRLTGNKVMLPLTALHP